MHHKPPNNVRVQLLWICFSLAPPDPVFWYLQLRSLVTSWQPGDRQPEDNGLPSYQRPMVYRKNAAWHPVSDFFLGIWEQELQVEQEVAKAIGCCLAGAPSSLKMSMAKVTFNAKGDPLDQTICSMYEWFGWLNNLYSLRTPKLVLQMGDFLGKERGTISLGGRGEGTELGTGTSIYVYRYVDT
jgi:hypothetical protein